MKAKPQYYRPNTFLLCIYVELIYQQWSKEASLFLRKYQPLQVLRYLLTNHPLHIDSLITRELVPSFNVKSVT